jgi:hypothetical protein
LESRLKEEMDHDNSNQNYSYQYEENSNNNNNANSYQDKYSGTNEEMERDY